jgi:glutamate-1-semialdehyde 2,1-aminomutase
MATVADSSVLPFGISSHGRGLPDVDGVELMIVKSKGAHLHSADGRSYIDYGMAMGACLVGHGLSDVVEACKAALDDGPMPGFKHPRELKAATALSKVGGRMSKVTFTSTGSEAVHLASRIARAKTGRHMIAKAVGGYDGWYDEFRYGLVDSAEAGRGNERPSNGDFTLLRVNDTADLEQLFSELGDQLAAIVIEPMLGNAACLCPDPAYFARLNALAAQHGVLIISDEVMVGLRLGLKPVSEQVGLKADLMTMGKAIGSGLPVAAVLGTPDAFSVVESGQVGCYGTYQGNPVVSAAVSATLGYLEKTGYDAYFDAGRALQDGIIDAFGQAGITVCTSGFPGAFSIWFAAEPPKTYDEALTLVQRQASHFLYEELRREGVVTLPSPWGRLFVSFAHGEKEVGETVAAYRKAAQKLKAAGLLS